MRRRVLAVGVLLLIFLKGIWAMAVAPVIPYEWEVARRLIENYEDGVPERRIGADLNRLQALRVFAYVYSAVPERLNVRTNLERQEIWLEVIENQDHGQVLECAREVLKGLAVDGKSDLEKIAAIYNWIVQNTVFDTSMKEPVSSGNIWAYSAKGVFLKQRAVCSGYAAAFQLLCREAGIPCFTVNSRIKEHTWNAVYYGGAWRFVDASSERRTAQVVGIGSIYQYFLLDIQDLPVQQFQFDTAGGLTAQEYFDFFQYRTGKSQPDAVSSVHIEVMEQLASRRDPYAMYELGACFWVGSWVEQDSEKALFWYCKAAVQQAGAETGALLRPALERLAPQRLD